MIITQLLILTTSMGFSVDLLVLIGPYRGLNVALLGCRSGTFKTMLKTLQTFGPGENYTFGGCVFLYCLLYNKSNQLTILKLQRI